MTNELRYTQADMDEQYRSGKEFMAREYKKLLDGDGTAAQKVAAVKALADEHVATRDKARLDAEVKA